MGYDKRHKTDYRQLNIKLHYDTDKDVIEFFDNVPNQRKALCAVVREWLDPIGGYIPMKKRGDSNG